MLLNVSIKAHLHHYKESKGLKEELWMVVSKHLLSSYNYEILSNFYETVIVVKH